MGQLKVTIKKFYYYYFSHVEFYLKFEGAGN